MYDATVSKESVEQRVRDKFESILATGKARAVHTLEKLEKERPVDRIVSTQAVKFEPSEDNGGIIIDVEGDKFTVHKHALNQAVTKTGLIGQTTINKLMETGQPWARELTAEILNKTYANTERERVLMRSVNGQVRGWQSDRYRRMDSGPIFESFISATRLLGAIPTDAKALDTKMALTMSLPHIFDVVPGQPLGMALFGATLSNSDFGDGALAMMFSVTRIICTNLAMWNEIIRQVHLGKRLSDDVTYSEQTYALDTQTQASAVKDMVAGFLGPAHINDEIARVRVAASEKVDVGVMFAALRKSGQINKEEQKKLIETFNQPDVELLPPGNNLWRASNTLSLFAQDAEVSPDRSLELQKLAGEVLKNIQVAA